MEDEQTILTKIIFALNDNNLVWAIIFDLAKLFNYRCALCHGICLEGKGWTIHHRKYRRNKSGQIIEKIYSDFKLDNGKPDRLSYYKYLIPLVKKQKRRFALLHHKCHYAVGTLARYKKENRRRLIKLAEESWKESHTKIM